MTPTLDYMLIVDLEATCWLGPPPDGQRCEVIEIGVTALDLATFEPGRRDTVIVRPRSSEISAFCTELTGITPEMAADGVPLADACRWLETEFGAPSRMWGSWGSYDRKTMVAQCEADGVPHPFSPHHANLKRIYGILTRQKHGLGLKAALEQLGLPFDGAHHRGIDDAYNAARVTQVMLTTYGFEAFTAAMPKLARPAAE
jgi:inhibitor of KinA sporulation pathway (predicted exonuclease)